MKKIIIAILVLFSVKSFSQNQKATLHFRDDSEITGLGKIVGEQIKFRKEKGAEKTFYDHTKIKWLIIRENDVDVEYHYKIIEGKGTILLLQILEAGNVNLYKISSTYHNNKMMTSGFGGFGGFGGGMSFGVGGSFTISSYYVSKKDEDQVIHLGAKGTLFTKNFKKAASEYFKDCASLVEKIQNREYKKQNIVEIVEYYNEKCSN